MKISIVIPAYNEEKFIGKLLRSIENMTVPKEVSLELVVVLNRCTDNTELIAREFGAKVVVNNDKNLSSIRNTGVRVSSGDWVITIDADSQMANNSLIEIVKAIQTEHYVGGGMVLKPERTSLGIAVGYGMFLIPAAFMQVSFGLYWFKREYFDQINGFDERKHIAEDVDFYQRLKQYGKKIGKTHKKINTSIVVTSCRKFDQFGDWHFVRSFSNPCRVIQAMRGKNTKFLDDNWYEVKR